MYAPARSPALRLAMRPLWPVKESLGRLSDLELAPRLAQSQSLTRPEAPFRFRSVEPRFRRDVNTRAIGFMFIDDSSARRGWQARGWTETERAPIGIDPPEFVCVYNGKFSPRGLAERRSASARGLRAVRRSATDHGSLVAPLRQNVPCRLPSGCCVAVARFAFRWPETLPK